LISEKGDEANCLRKAASSNKSVKSDRATKSGFKKMCFIRQCVRLYNLFLLPRPAPYLYVVWWIIRVAQQ